MKYKIGITDKRRSRIPKRSGIHGNLELNSSSLLGSKFRNIKKMTKHEKTPNKALKKKNIRKVIGKIFTIFFGIGFFLFVAGAIVVSIELKDIAKSLPEPGKLIERTSSQSTIIYDRNGKELYKIFGDENREYVKLADLPEETRRNVIVSLLAAEDAEFYSHKGVDYVGIARCTYLSTLGYITNGAKGGSCGASTISQQLLRNTLLKDIYQEEAFERSDIVKTVKRKVREILFTLQVEKTFTKDQLLEMYFNEVGMGSVNYGWEAGSQATFGKDVRELTLAESAMLAGIIQSPGVDNPVFGTHPEQAVTRQTYVFDQMKEHKDALNLQLAKLNLPQLTDEDIENARTEELKYSEAKYDILAPHFVMYVKDQLIEKYGNDLVENGGLKVTTTLDYEAQQIAEGLVTQRITQYGYGVNVYNAALVAIDPRTGQLIAMVGSADYWNKSDARVDGNVNVATSLRQMGSSVKPIGYITAFQQGYGPWMAAPDLSEFNFNYQAYNWDFKYYGSMTVREALVKSRNIPALYTMQLIGVDSFLNTAEKVGITTLTDKSNYGLSLMLGSGEMKLVELTAAYGVFANEGVKNPTISILKVVDNKGNVLEEYKEPQSERIFDEKDAYMLNWTLCDLGGYGDGLEANQYLRNGRRFVCGKTGTTNGPKDLISFAYHKNIVVGVWAGNNNNDTFPYAYPGLITVPISNQFVSAMESKYPSELYNRPANILATTVCNDTGTTPKQDTNCPRVSSIYKYGSAPQQDKREVVKVCKATGKIPSNLAIASKYEGLLEDRVLINFEPENKAQRDNFFKYFTNTLHYLITKPETDVCALPLGPDNAPVVDFVSPVENATVEAGKTINLEATVRVLSNASYVQFGFDGTNISGARITAAPYKYTFTVPAGTTVGTHTINATVVDDQGKTGTTTVQVTVTAAPTATPTVSISLTAPANNATITLDSFPVTVSANVSGGTVTNVTFTITQEGGSYTSTLTDSNGANGWSAPWPSDAGITAGVYIIQASATVSGSSTVNSESIRINITE